MFDRLRADRYLANASVPGSRGSRGHALSARCSIFDFLVVRYTVERVLREARICCSICRIGFSSGDRYVKCDRFPVPTYFHIDSHKPCITLLFLFLFFPVLAGVNHSVLNNVFTQIPYELPPSRVERYIIQRLPYTSINQQFALKSTGCIYEYNPNRFSV